MRPTNPPTKQRKHFVLAGSEETAQPVIDALRVNGMLPSKVSYLRYPVYLNGYGPDELAFIFLDDFRDHHAYHVINARVHDLISKGAVVEPKPLTAADLTIDPDKIRKWQEVFRDVVTDGVGDRPRSNLRQAAEKAADALDPPCDCYYCRNFELTGEEATSGYRLDGTWNGAESAPEEPEYLQVFLGGIFHGTKTPRISIVPSTEFFFTDDEDVYETYRLTEHYVLGKRMYFWVHVSLWDDRQRVVREYLIEPLEG